MEVDVRVCGGVSSELLTRDDEGGGAAGVHHHRGGHGARQDGAPGHQQSSNGVLINYFHLEIFVKCKVRGAPCISNLHLSSPIINI